MTTKEKLFEKFIENPMSLRYKDIEKLLLLNWFLKIDAKGSHLKMKHHLLEKDLVFPIHNWDCKYFYKQIRKEKLLFIKQLEKWDII